jgi:hypothetical protein
MTTVKDRYFQLVDEKIPYLLEGVPEADLTEAKDVLKSLTDHGGTAPVGYRSSLYLALERDDIRVSLQSLGFERFLDQLRYINQGSRKLWQRTPLFPRLRSLDSYLEVFDLETPSYIGILESIGVFRPFFSIDVYKYEP